MSGMLDSAWLRFLVAALATWRLSSLLVAEDGPGRVFGRLRDFVGVEDGAQPGFWRDLLGCIWCVSVWVGALCAFLAFLPGEWWYFLWPFALSAMAILIGRYLGQA